MQPQQPTSTVIPVNYASSQPMQQFQAPPSYYGSQYPIAFPVAQQWPGGGFQQSNFGSSQENSGASNNNNNLWSETGKTGAKHEMVPAPWNTMEMFCVFLVCLTPIFLFFGILDYNSTQRARMILKAAVNYSTAQNKTLPLVTNVNCKPADVDSKSNWVPPSNPASCGVQNSPNS